MVSAVRRALAQLSPSRLVQEALVAYREEPVLLVAMGKAAGAMAEGAVSALGPRVERGLVVVPSRTRTPRLPASLQVLRAAHPLPDARSVEAAERILRAVCAHRGPVLVLISGGASSLVAAPAPGLSLEQKQEIVSGLLASGAPIKAINTVRRHLSSIKGGGLLRAAWPSRVHTLVLSDVIGGRLADVGSGPSLPSPTRLASARSAVCTYMDRALAASLPFQPALDPRAREAALGTSSLLASPELLAERVAAELARPDRRVRVGAPVTAPVEEVAELHLRLASRLRPGHALVFAAEPTVRLPGARLTRGRGGRCSHLAALVALGLPPGVLFLAAASDGVDGASGAAGALVSSEVAVGRRGEIQRALRRFDTGTLHLSMGTALRLPRGHNLADVHVLARP